MVILVNSEILILLNGLLWLLEGLATVVILVNKILEEILEL